MDTAATIETAAAPASATYSLWQLVRCMLGLGSWGLGGPAALLGFMYRDLVEKRQWISKGDYKGGMTRVKRIAVWLDGQRFIEFTDGHIAGAGAVGVWTKADSVTAFNEFAYGAARP